MPKVSIIIPCYKVEKYLKRCLDSVLAQTFCEWEAICVDDGSPDDCGQILDEYARQDSRFKIIHQTNQGVSAARNHALEQAAGEFIAFIDSDDVVAPSFLTSLLSALEANPEADISACGFIKAPEVQPWIENDKPALIYHQPFEHYVLHRKPKIASVIWNKLFRRSLLEGLKFDTDLAFGEDLIFLYQVLYRARQMVHLPQDLYFYRLRADSAMNREVALSRLDNELLVAAKLAKIFFNKIMSNKITHALNHYIAKRFFYYAIKFPKTKKYLNFSEYKKQSIRILQQYKYEKLFKPKDLSIINRLVYWWYVASGR